MQLVERTLDILMILSKETDGLSVSELAERIEIPNSSTHRILNALRQNHFVSQDPGTKKYRIGYKVLTLCANITKENALTRTARPFMRELAEQLGKTVTLCVMEGEHVICLDYIESKDTSMFLVRTGFAMPPHATSAGKVLQAYMPIERVQQIYKNSAADKLTSYTRTNLQDLLEELEQVRQNGFAIVDEELQLGVQGVACPVFDFEGRAVASVAFTALKADNSLNTETIGRLKDCASRISRSLGGR